MATPSPRLDTRAADNAYLSPRSSEQGNRPRRGSVDSIFMRALNRTATSTSIGGVASGTATPSRLYRLDSPTVFANMSDTGLLDLPDSADDQSPEALAAIKAYIQFDGLHEALRQAQGDFGQIPSAYVSSLIQDPSIVEKLDLSDVFPGLGYDNEHVYNCLDQLIHNFPEVKDLNLSGYPGLDAKCLEKISQWKNLTTLTLNSSAKIVCENPALFERFNNLQTLNVASCDLNDAVLAEICKNLQLDNLDLSGAPITCDGARKLCNLNHLRSLNVSKCEQLNSEAFRLISELPSINELNVTSTNLDLESLGYLANMEKLRILYLGSDEISYQVLASFRAKCPSVKIVTDSRNLTDCLKDIETRASQKSVVPTLGSFGDSLSVIVKA